jgi:hypothetical protein
MRSTAFLAALTLGLHAALLLPLPAQADDGHGHGDAAPSASSHALPRFAAVSESFELVGVLDGKRITLYLDRAADNAPVHGARIELDLGGGKLLAQPHEDVYEVQLAAAPAPGVLPISATVTAAEEVDLLVGELDLHAPEEAAGKAQEEAQAPQVARARPWTLIVGGGAIALAGLGAGLFAGRRGAARQRRDGVVA